MDEHKLLGMIDLYLAGKLTGEQHYELDQWYASFENKKELFKEDSDSMRKLAELKFCELKNKLYMVEFVGADHSEAN